MNYYISIGGAQRGPFPAEQLAAQGLRPDTLVWAEGMAQWERADRIPDLQPVVARLEPASGGFGSAQPFRPGQPAQPVQPVQGMPPYGGPPPYGGYGPQGPQLNYSNYPSQGVHPALAEANSKKMVAGLCGIFLGTFGVHKFVMGYTTAGVIMACLSLTCVGMPVMHLIGLIEGIMYLSKSDAEFYQTYMVQKKEWF